MWPMYSGMGRKEPMKLPTHPKDGLPSSEQTFPTTYKKLTKIIFQKTLLYSR